MARVFLLVLLIITRPFLFFLFSDSKLDYQLIKANFCKNLLQDLSPISCSIISNSASDFFQIVAIILLNKLDIVYGTGLLSDALKLCVLLFIFKDLCSKMLGNFGKSLRFYLALCNAFMKFSHEILLFPNTTFITLLQ